MANTRTRSRPGPDRIKLTEHVFGFKKMVMGELFYFGYEPAIAQSRAMPVMAMVNDLKSNGVKRWPPATLTLAKAIAKGLDQPVAVGTLDATEPVPAVPPKDSQPTAAPTGIADDGRNHAGSPAPAKPVAMIHDTIDAYAEHIRATACKARDHCYRGRILAQKRAIKNMPLDQVGERELVALVNFWKSKPSGTRCVYVAATKGWKVIDTGSPLAARTVKSNIGTARQMFRWLASSASGYNWSAPNLQPIFEMKNADVERMRTPAEKMLEVRARNDEAAEHFTLDELTKLWEAASTTHRRLFFLLALNAGCLNSELSGLLVGHCFLDGNHADKPFIAFMRPKTGMYGKWFLWKETADDLKSHLRPTFPYGWIDDEVEANLKKYVVKNRVYQPTGNTSPRSVWDTELTLAQWRKARVEERERWERYNRKDDPSENVFLTEDHNLLLTTSPNGHRNDAVKLVWDRWSATAKVTRLSWKHMRKTASQLVRRAATDIGLNGDYMSELFLAHQAPVMSRPYNKRDDSEFEQLGRVLSEVRKRLGPVFGDADKHE
jgi:hypothetical protein